LIPFNDTERNRYSFFPFMTVGIISACVVVFIVQSTLDGQAYGEFLARYSFIPAMMMSGAGGGMLSNLTSMFLHGGLAHLLGNMLALWVFGRRVEDACGPWRFLAFYLLAGTGANILYALVEREGALPSIGASGAIFGVMGAYLLLYPAGRIRTFVLLGFVPLWPRIRAFWVVVYFVGIQVVPALDILLHKARYSVNHWAHLGGFFSAVLILLFIRPAAFARYMSDAQV
jgi:membrane associated rhomboid family serine protease